MKFGSEQAEAISQGFHSLLPTNNLKEKIYILNKNNRKWSKSFLFFPCKTKIHKNICFPANRIKDPVNKLRVQLPNDRVRSRTNNCCIGGWRFFSLIPAPSLRYSNLTRWIAMGMNKRMVSTFCPGSINWVNQTLPEYLSFLWPSNWNRLLIRIRSRIVTLKLQSSTPLRALQVSTIKFEPLNSDLSKNKKKQKRYFLVRISRHREWENEALWSFYRAGPSRIQTILLLATKPGRR